MGSLIVYVVIIMFIWRMIAAQKKNINSQTDLVKNRQTVAKAAKSGMHPDAKNYFPPEQSIAKHATRKSKNSGVHPDMAVKVPVSTMKEGKISSSLRDDRNNDWLACQMRFERNSLSSLRDMFGFRMEGRGMSDAELLREFHASHCDANKIDRANAK